MWESSFRLFDLVLLLSVRCRLLSLDDLLELVEELVHLLDTPREPPDLFADDAPRFVNRTIARLIDPTLDIAFSANEPGC